MRLFTVFLCCLCVIYSATGQRTRLPGSNADYPYLVYYGNWTDAQVSFARNHYKLVLLHPTVSNISPEQIATIQSGIDGIPGTGDDVLVLGYLSIGEDDRPGAPFTGDGTGPRVDPRPRGVGPFRDIDMFGHRSPGGGQYASYYLDDGSLLENGSSAHDGLPDRNATFGAYYVNAGDPAWIEILRNSTKEIDGKAGMDELLTRTTGAGYGCDGLLLDTLDVAAPNSYGATQHEWTAPGMSALIGRIAATFPEKVMMGNRGLFYYDPNLEHYRFTTRGSLNAVLFEGYYSDSNSAGLPSPYFCGNKAYLAPKLNAESQRPDGFSIFALDYFGPDGAGVAGELAYRESQLIQGWPLYRSNSLLTTTPFSTDAVSWNTNHPDLAAPAWDSTFSGDSAQNEARIGIQEVVPGNGSATIRWDVARDQSGPVHYNIYYGESADFLSDPDSLISAVEMTTPPTYAEGSSSHSFPFEYTVGNLVNGTRYYFAVRAEDFLGHEDSNTQVLSTIPRGISSQFMPYPIEGNITPWEEIPSALGDPIGDGIPDMVSVKIANNREHLFLLLEYNQTEAVNAFEGSPSIFLSLDRDRDPSTGYDIYGRGLIGAEVSWQNAEPFLQSTNLFNTGQSLTDALPLITPYRTRTGSQQYVISRNARFRDLSGAEVRVFPDAPFRLAIWSDGDSPEFLGWIDYSFASIPVRLSYDTWKTGTFTDLQLQNPEISGPEADWDGDGQSVLLEYALGTNPLAGDKGLVVEGAHEPGQQSSIRVSFRQRTEVAGLIYEIEVSKDLITWETDPNQLVEIARQPSSPGFDQVIVGLRSPANARVSFLRLRVAFAGAP